MGWLEQLYGETVALDTAPFIYLMEENSLYSNIVQDFFERLNQGNFRAVTSMVSLLEVLVHPLRIGNDQLVSQYKEILCHSKNISIVGVTSEIAEQAALLRAKYHLRTPDAIQLATMLCKKAHFFLTNDKRLPKIPNISIIVLDDVVERFNS